MVFRQYRRSSLRVPGWDYAGYGWYHITIRVQEERCVFGAIDRGIMRLNACGIFMESYLRVFPFLYPFVRIDTYQIMPDHFHMILELADGSNVPFERFIPYKDERLIPVRTGRKSLGNIIGAFKTVTTQGINTLRFPRGTQIWQRNFHDRIIQNEDELHQVREYIRRNPERWKPRIDE